MKAVITGRRASQGADRANLQPIEVDSTGLVKLNPLFAWTFPFVQWYVDENKVPRNKLLDQGYRSIGDWHSTAKSADGDQGERAGRWAGKADKTECGLHVDYFKMKAAAEQKVCIHATRPVPVILIVPLAEREGSRRAVHARASCSARGRN